jgi:hypothetical protein
VLILDASLASLVLCLLAQARVTGWLYQKLKLAFREDSTPVMAKHLSQEPISQH